MISTMPVVAIPVVERVGSGGQTEVAGPDVVTGAADARVGGSVAEGTQQLAHVVLGLVDVPVRHDLPVREWKSGGRGQSDAPPMLCELQEAAAARC